MDKLKKTIYHGPEGKKRRYYLNEVKSTHDGAHKSATIMMKVYGGYDAYLITPVKFGNETVYAVYLRPFKEKIK